MLEERMSFLFWFLVEVTPYSGLEEGDTDYRRHSDEDSDDEDTDHEVSNQEKSSYG
jgi:hypothetical protein